MIKFLDRRDPLEARLVLALAVNDKADLLALARANGVSVSALSRAFLLEGLERHGKAAK
jgi:post-segregation antitoxin (ccd killing protein)